ncbi:hypothetical protein KL86CLO1_10602 [uncultured Eubacteriales bacterium]|uniref:Uncharacterized protein n=1 Tax=uncultured Eubacteriales bacterium TaxID=172733 RepID=A0A212J6N7_9FIRM|nr:hypothetical protein KL86CLO1_10602 [uncultured Eubacteriales bacterium]
MMFSATNDGSVGPLPCGFMSCGAAVGLLAGTSREEKRAMRQAERAERAFRAQKGYRDSSPLSLLLYKLRSGSTAQLH